MLGRILGIGVGNYPNEKQGPGVFIVPVNVVDFRLRECSAFRSDSEVISSARSNIVLSGERHKYVPGIPFVISKTAKSIVEKRLLCFDCVFTGMRFGWREIEERNNVIGAYSWSPSNVGDSYRSQQPFFGSENSSMFRKIGVFDHNVRASIYNGAVSSFLSRTSLPSSHGGIDSHENDGANLHDKSFIVTGCIVFALGVMLLYKVLWKLGFDFASNVNVPTYVALVGVCFVVMWIGLWLFGVGFHLFSLASFHGSNTLTS